ncbi:hypothetical protein [Dyella sp. 2HG41-7]|uniref:hypothetical protein n=1 Tax=Dyella sp. 2HG41-7 TaxID=2883239 RepID=UPI001F1B32B1|nr:hypothetical protein [Dyella sp. 2HG41-7]
MRLVIAGFSAFLLTACSADAPHIPKLDTSPSNSYLFVCRSKAAMQELMDSGTAFRTSRTVVDRLAKHGDCLLIPYESIKSIGDATDNGTGPVPITVQKDSATVTMWGYPVQD